MTSKPRIQIEDLAKAVENPNFMVEFAMSHPLEEVEEMRRALEQGAEIGENQLVTEAIKRVIVHEAMSSDLAQDPTALLKIRKKLETF